MNKATTVGNWFRSFETCGNQLRMSNVSKRLRQILHTMSARNPAKVATHTSTTTGKRPQWPTLCETLANIPKPSFPTFPQIRLRNSPKNKSHWSTAASKQRYFTKIGDDYYPEPAQWDVTNHVWRP